MIALPVLHNLGTDMATLRARVVHVTVLVQKHVLLIVVAQVSTTQATPEPDVRPRASCQAHRQQEQNQTHQNEGFNHGRATDLGWLWVLQLCGQSK